MSSPDVPSRGMMWLQQRGWYLAGGAISISVTPAGATVAPGGTLQFTATLTNTSMTIVKWSASSGSISDTGLFTAPLQSGTVQITAQSPNHRIQSSTTVTVAAPLKISTLSLSGSQVGTSYAATLTATGGTRPYNWSLSSGSLPPGLSLSSEGTISGTPTQAGTFSFAVKVSDDVRQSSTQPFAVVAKSTTTTTGNTGGSTGSGSTGTSTGSNGGGASGSNGSGAGNQTFDGPAELPQVYVQSTMADTPAPGNTIVVPAGGNLQTALNNANCGDTVELQAETTYSGSFVLPAKACDDQHWIILRSSASDAQLPPEGTRMTPCYEGVTSLPGRPAYPCSSPQNLLSKLVASKGMPTIRLEGGANHYRIGPGLDITRAAGDGFHGALIGHATPITLGISKVVIDRDWIHGTAIDDTMRGVNLDAMSYAALVDSYLNDFHCAAQIGACVDAQAIAGGNGFLAEGPWQIQNNFLEGAAENILFGGSGGSIIPADITIQHNHLFKPMTWMWGSPGFVGVPNTDTKKCTSTPGYCPFVVKNLFELKNAQRLLFEGNVLENTWAGFGQYASSMLLMAMNQGDLTGNPNATVADITIRYSLSSHTGKGVSIANTKGTWGPAKLAARFSIHDDVFEDISPAFANGATSQAVGTAFEISDCPTCAPMYAISIDHVTMLLQSPVMLMSLGTRVGTTIQNVTFTNNIVSTPPGQAITGTEPVTPCGFHGTSNLVRLNNCLAPYTFQANALVGAGGTWPVNNFFPSDNTAVQFADYNGGSGGDYHLASTSPYVGMATDGTDLGADIDKVDQATAGVQ